MTRMALALPRELWDNRDLHTTEFDLSNGRLEVDPVELFRDALENAGMGSIEASQWIEDIVNRIDEIQAERDKQP